jgi:hypothetical protein
MTWSDNVKAAEAHRTARDADADEQIAALRNGRHNGSSSWCFGRGGRSGTEPSLFGLGRRVVNDAAQENAKSGFFGYFGAKYVAEKAARAQRNGK